MFNVVSSCDVGLFVAEDHQVDCLGLLGRRSNNCEAFACAQELTSWSVGKQTMISADNRFPRRARAGTHVAYYRVTIFLCGSGNVWLQHIQDWSRVLKPSTRSCVQLFFCTAFNTLKHFQVLAGCSVWYINLPTLVSTDWTNCSCQTPIVLVPRLD